MSTEQNKAAVRRLNEAVNKGNFDIAPELFAADFIFHTTPEAKGPEGFKQTMTVMKTAFPDYHETIENMVAEGDMVAVFYTLKGTFTGKFGDTAPTGKKFSLPAVVLARFKNGKQVEAWPYMDSLSWYQQMGVPIPS